MLVARFAKPLETHLAKPLISQIDFDTVKSIIVYGVNRIGENTGSYIAIQNCEVADEIACPVNGVIL